MPLTKDGDILAVSEPATTAWFPVEEPAEPTSNSPDPASSITAPQSEGITPDEARIAKLELDDKYREDFEGLMYLGELQYTFKWSGHTFSIHTLRIDELLEIGMLVKRFEGSLGSNRGYITAFAAASLDRVDGRLLHNPLGPEDQALPSKFQYITRQWYPWTVDAIYERCMMLEARVAQIIEAMGEVSG